jgi:hypothetical protein
MAIQTVYERLSENCTAQHTENTLNWLTDMPAPEHFHQGAAAGVALLLQFALAIAFLSAQSAHVNNSTQHYPASSVCVGVHN